MTSRPDDCWGVVLTETSLADESIDTTRRPGPAAGTGDPSLSGDTITDQEQSRSTTQEIFKAREPKYDGGSPDPWADLGSGPLVNVPDKRIPGLKSGDNYLKDMLGTRPWENQDSNGSPAPTPRTPQEKKAIADAENRIVTKAKQSVVEDLLYSSLMGKDGINLSEFFAALGPLSKSEKAEVEKKFNEKYSKDLQALEGAGDLRQLITLKGSRGPYYNNTAQKLLLFLDQELSIPKLAEAVAKVDTRQTGIGAVVSDPLLKYKISSLSPSQKNQLEDEFQQYITKFAWYEGAGRPPLDEQLPDISSIAAIEEIRDQIHSVWPRWMGRSGEWFSRELNTPESEKALKRSEQTGLATMRKWFNGQSEENIDTFIKAYDELHGQGEFWRDARDHFSEVELKEVHALSKGYNPTAIASSLESSRFTDRSVLYGLTGEQIAEVKEKAQKPYGGVLRSELESRIAKLGTVEDVTKRREAGVEQQVKRDRSSRYIALPPLTDEQSVFISELNSKKHWAGLDTLAYRFTSPLHEQNGIKYDCNSDVLRCINLEESSLRGDAVSKTYCVGHMGLSRGAVKDVNRANTDQSSGQPKPGTKLLKLDTQNPPRVGFDDRLDEVANCDAGAHYFSLKLDEFRGHLGLGLAAYRAGADLVFDALVIHAQEKLDLDNPTRAQALEAFLNAYPSETAFDAIAGALNLDYVEAQKKRQPNYEGDPNATPYLIDISEKLLELTQARESAARMGEPIAGL